LFEFSEFADNANSSWAVVPSEMLIHVQMSSSAKADDPVRRAVRDLSSAGDTRFRGYDGCAWGIPRGKISRPGRTYLSLALSRNG
jgi:hypothetical protein